MRITWLSALLSLLLLLTGTSAQADEVRYYLQEFGDKQALLILEGDVNSLSSNLSSDKQVLRISGVDSSYRALKIFRPSPFVSDIRAMKQGLNRELLVYFGNPVEIKTLPSEHYLSFLITGDATEGTQHNPNEVTNQCEQQLSALRTQVRELEAQVAALQFQQEQLKQAASCPSPEPKTTPAGPKRRQQAP